MTYTAARPIKDQVKKAVGDTMKDNEKLYKLLEEYDEKAKTKTPRTAHLITCDTEVRRASVLFHTFLSSSIYMSIEKYER